MATELCISGRYKILKKAGEGRLGEFFEARDLVTNVPYLAKIYFKEKDVSYFTEILKEIEDIKRFKRIRHPSLVSIVEVLYDKESHIVIFQPIEGISLKDFLDTHHTIPPPERMIKITSSLLVLLIFLHKQYPPIFLGPLLPSKLLLTSTGPKLLQFELDIIYGKPSIFLEVGFYPPEIHKRDKDAEPLKFGVEGDLYSLSALLYYTLDKEPPPVSTSTTTIEVKNPYVSPEIKNLIAQCLKPNPEERINSAVTFKKILEEPVPQEKTPIKGKETVIGRFLNLIDRTFVEFNFFWKINGIYFIMAFIVIMLASFIAFTIKEQQEASFKKAPLLSIASGSLLAAINTVTRKPHYIIDLKSTISSLYFLPSENLLAATTTSPAILYLCRPESGKIVHKLEMGYELNSIAYSPINEFFYYILKGEKEIKTVIPGVLDIDANKGKSIPIKLSQETDILSVDRSGIFLYSASTAKKVLIIVDLVTNKEISSMMLKGTPVSLIPIKAGNVLVLENYPPGLSIINGTMKKITEHRSLPFLGISKGVAADNGEKVFLWNTAQPRLAVITELNQPKVKQVPFSFLPQELFVSEDKGLIYASDTAGNIHIMNISDYQELASFELGNTPSDFLIFSPIR